MILLVAFEGDGGDGGGGGGFGLQIMKNFIVFFCVLSYISGVHHFLVRFVYM